MSNVKFLYTLVVWFAMTQAFPQTYTYDNLNRLTKVVYNNGTTITYTFDALGNRTSKKVIGSTVNTYTITTSVIPAGSGTVTGGGKYINGATAELQAIANAGYEFSAWNDGTTINPRTITVTRDMNFTAQFVESSEKPELLGDIVVDGQVNQQDLDALVNAYLNNTNATKVTDLDSDGQLTMADITKLIGVIGYVEDHECVDLGLPSGTKWATCNIGASKPEDNGYFYAWGETEVKDSYTQNNYAHYDVTTNSYINIGSDIAGTQYDVAHVKWRGEWVMPSEDQFDELCDYCTKEWITLNGVNGRRFTGKNGNSIFLPAGEYWASNDYYSIDGVSSYLQNDEDKAKTKGHSRFFANKVRPVMRNSSQSRANAFGSQTLSVGDIEVTTGGQAMVPIIIEQPQNYIAAGYILELPHGVAFVNQRGLVSNFGSNHILKSNLLYDNVLKAASYSLFNASFGSETDCQGIGFIAQDLKSGNYQGQIKNLQFVTVNNQLVTFPNQTFSINVKDNEQGVETILQATDSNDVWYDLNGRRLVDTPKSGGVYIRNGVKVVVVNYNSK